MNLLFRSATWVALGTLLVFTASTDPYATTRTLAKDCFSGKWGNDYILCGEQRVNKPGKGDAKKRQQEELILQFKGKDKGELSFYDCQNGKRATSTVPFHYELADAVIRFYWEGTTSEIESIQAAFSYRDTFRYDCRKDTLVFTDGFLNNSLYKGSTYFVRR